MNLKRITLALLATGTLFPAAPVKTNSNVKKTEPTSVQKNDSTAKTVEPNHQQTSHQTIPAGNSAAIDQKSNDKKELMLINKIEAVVIGPEGNDIIDTFDVQRPGIDGRMRTIDDRILERKMYQDAKSMKIVDPEAVQKQLKTVQKDNNLSEEALRGIFQAGGYSYEEGVQQFEVMTAVNQITGFKVASKMIIPEKDIVAYYNAHPEMLEAEYNIRFAQFPSYAAASSPQLKKKIASGDLVIAWDEPFWIKHTEIAQEKNYIYKLKPKQIHVHRTATGGYELIQLVEKKDERPVPLAERYAEIERALQPQKYQQLFVDYKKELDDKMAVIRF